MDEELGDIHSIIVDREIEIIQKLKETIAVYEKDILETCKICSEIDW